MNTKMNLTQFAQQEMKNLLAGYVVEGDRHHVCGCGCYYANSGGSSTDSNKNANYINDLASPPLPDSLTVIL